MIIVDLLLYFCYACLGLFFVWIIAMRMSFLSYKYVFWLFAVLFCLLCSVCSVCFFGSLLFVHSFVLLSLFFYISFTVSRFGLFSVGFSCAVHSFFFVFIFVRFIALLLFLFCLCSLLGIISTKNKIKIQQS